MPRTEAELEAEVDAVADELDRLSKVDDGSPHIPRVKIQALRERLLSVAEEASPSMAAKLRAYLPLFDTQVN